MSVPSLTFALVHEAGDCIGASPRARRAPIVTCALELRLRPVQVEHVVRHEHRRSVPPHRARAQRHGLERAPEAHGEPQQGSATLPAAHFQHFLAHSRLNLTVSGDLRNSSFRSIN